MRYMMYTCDEGAGYNIMDCGENNIAYTARYFTATPEMMCKDEASQPTKQFWYDMMEDGWSNCVVEEEGKFSLKFRNPNWIREDGPGGDMREGEWASGAKSMTAAFAAGALAVAATQF